MTDNTIASPVYRYFTADLLTNRILEEIPFRGVSYERTIKGAGAFQGAIPVISSTDNLDLYENTMPGNTAVFVVRNGICVWGGIIWSRSYNIVDRVLQINAAEFTSYFYHRRVWKTLTQGYGATVDVYGDLGTVTFDDGSITPLKAGSSIRIEFDAAENMKYDGYYRVAGSPAPTTSKFNLESTKSTVDIESIRRDDNTIILNTKTRHGFNTDDKIYVDLGPTSEFTGTHTISVRGGVDSKTFRFTLQGADFDREYVTGTSSRPLPNGTYKNSTITIKTDTYDYIRNLIDAVAKDFTGPDFPNTYIEPGIRTAYNITQAEIDDGVAIIDTDQENGLSDGQSVEIKNLSDLFDGEHAVSATITNKKFSFLTPGVVAQYDVSVKEAEVSAVRINDTEAVVVTVLAHNFKVGEIVDISLESDLGPFSSNFSGSFEITAVPSTTSFKYKAIQKGSLPLTVFSNPTVTRAGNTFDVLSGNVGVDTKEFTITTRSSSGTTRTITTSETHDVVTNDVIRVTDLTDSYNGQYTVTGVSSTTITYTGTGSVTETVSDAGTVTRYKSEATLYTDETHGFAVGNSVTVANANFKHRIVEKGYDAANSLATITTSVDHLLRTGDSVDIIGLRDSSDVVSKKITGSSASKEVTLTTSVAHNFEVGDIADISDMQDVYLVTKKKLASNVFTITTGTNHNLAIGNEIEVTGIVDKYAVTKYRLTNSVARLIIGTHNYRVNDKVTVVNLKDSAVVVSKELQSGVATLTTDFAHNLASGTEITVSNVGDKFDGTFTILNSTDTQVQYETAVVDEIRNAEAAYNDALASAIRRGVADPSTDSTVKDKRKILLDLTNGNRADMPPTKTDASKAVIKSTTSIFNGGHRVTAIGSNYIEYRLGGNNVPLATVTNLTKSVTNKEASAEDCTLTLNNITDLAVGDIIDIPSGVGARFEGIFSIASIDVDTKKIKYKKEGQTVASAAVSGQSITTRVEVSGDSPFNGTFDVASVPSATTATYNISMPVTKTIATTTVCTVTFTSKYSIAVNDSIVVAGVGAPFNGTVTVLTLNTADDKTTITYTNSSGTPSAENNSPTGTVTPVRNNVSETVVPLVVADGDPRAVVGVESVHNGSRTITKVTRNTFSFDQTISQTVDFVDTTGKATVDSIFNGINIIVTVTSDTTFEYTLVGSKNNVLETANTQVAFVIVDNIFNGTHTVTKVDPEDNQFSYRLAPSRTTSIGQRILPGRGSATVRPVAIVSSFGPFPGNSDIGIEFSTTQYSGVNVIPSTYRGFELKSVGEILNSYADSIDGFEYRVDCKYDEVSNTFKKIFVLIPVNFPAPPPEGEVSPLSRFGADKLVFEYPGNISNVAITESAENSATRFFVVGENDLGPDAGPPFSVKASEGFLDGTHGARKWPLLDADLKIDNVEDETALYPYATRYLTEARPPEGQISISVNGSLSPVVGSYSPGDWCSIIVDDKFILQRMANDIELRDSVLVRKIDAMKISVPDGTTFPETVDLVLIPEWEVDKRG